MLNSQDAYSVDITNTKDGFITNDTLDDWVNPITTAYLDDIFEIELDEIHSLFDDRDYADCGFIAMAEHTTEMHSLDRMISESCYCPKNGGKVTHPRLIHSDGLTKHMRAEYISKRLQCNLNTAERFISDWRRLNLTPAIIETIIKGIQKKGSLASASLYFSNMASQMPDPDLLEHYDTMDRLQDELAYSDDVTDEEFLMEQDEREYEPVPDTHTFIPVGHDEPEPKPTFSWRYHNVIRDMNKSYSYIKIKALCGKTMKAKELSNLETSMFLLAYRDRLKEVKKYWIAQDSKLGAIHRRLLSTNKSNLPTAGNWLGNLESGKEVLDGYTPKSEGTKILKDLYFDRKENKPIIPIDPVRIDFKRIPSDQPTGTKPELKRTLPVVQAISQQDEPLSRMESEPAVVTRRQKLERLLRIKVQQSQTDATYVPVAQRIRAKLEALPFKFSYDGCPFMSRCKKRNLVEPCHAFAC